MDGLWLVAGIVLLLVWPLAVSGEDVGRAVIRVGLQDGDLRGDDGRVLQAAVDYVAQLGGGTVEIAPGRYELRNALHLRDGVRLRGSPGETILAHCDCFRSPLAKDGDCNQRAITVADPSGFRVGDGVVVVDKNFSGGFCVTTGTLTARLEANTFALSNPLYLDYYVSKGGEARLSFPVVGGWGIRDAAIEGLVIEGNAGNTPFLDGCRGGGIYLFECENVTIRDCHVRHYNGDGIAFQVSHDIVVEDCIAEENLNYGLHPGSGSQRPILRRNKAVRNKSDGLWVCWRVQHGLFENNTLVDNDRDGISIGHKDSDNVFRNNTIADNRRAGVLFRQEDEPMGAHRNVFENNRIAGNGGYGPQRAAVALVGAHHGVVFRENTLEDARTGFLIDEAASDFRAEANAFSNVAKEMAIER